MFWLKCLLFANIILFSLANKTSSRSLHGSSQYGRIVGGYKADIEDNPWQVALLYEGNFICGGSIIGKKWIITSAHCLM